MHKTPQELNIKLPQEPNLTISSHCTPVLNPKYYVGPNLAGLSNPQRIEKSWGYELIYWNVDYCLKSLVFLKAGGSTSMHFHVQKHETLQVIGGRLLLEIIDNKEHQHYILNPGCAWVVPPGHVHKLTALDGPLHLVEASTHDISSDSIRIA